MAGASPMPAGIATPQDLAVAMRYGPQTEQALRRSSYLTDALRQLNTEGSQNIHSGGELAAKLLASAILSRGVNRGQDAVMQALRADQGDETRTLLAGLRPPSGAPDSGAITPQPDPTPQPLPQPAPQDTPQAQPVPTQAQPSAYSPQDRAALIQMGAGEAGGEGPDGIAAAMHVALNRLRSGYGGAKSLYDVIHQPRQFTAIQNGVQPDPRALALASQVADGVLGGQVPDPTGGAQAFLNPELTQKLYGRIPAWAQGGDGRRIGNHVFFGGGQQVAQNGAQPPAGPQPSTPDAQPVLAGADPFPGQPSAPAQSPAAGAPPVGVTPQAPPAGAMPPSWPKWKPSQDKIDYVTSLLNDTKHHAEGVALADQYRQKMLEPAEAQITMINGVPFYVPKDPTDAIPSMAIPVPRAAMTHVATADQLGVPAAPGTTFDVDPLGNKKPLTAPPPGQEVASRPGQPYAEHYVPGGTNDPTVPQKPSAGYQYNPTGGQGAIPGSQADPRAPMNLVAGTQKIQENLKPIVDLARAGRQSYGTVGAGYQLQNGTGDIAMLKGLNHLINQGIVRPDDMEAQLKSDGISGGLGELTQFINSNGLLTPEIRNKVMLAAQAVYKSADQQFKAQVMGHRQTVDAVYGDGAFDKYVLPAEEAHALGWVAPDGSRPAPAQPQQQPQMSPGGADGAIAEAVRRGMRLTPAQHARAQAMGLVR